MLFGSLLARSLASLLASLGHGLAADSPIVRFHFIDDDKGGSRILAKNIDHELSRSLYEFFLLRETPRLL